MAEPSIENMSQKPKSEAYEAVLRTLVAILDGETDITAKMATVVAILSRSFDTYFWTGFYCVDPVKKAQGIDELVVGPYNGTLGCLRIRFGRGVCGTAAATGQTQIVKDVHALENHIACDAASRSEIVVPVFDNTGTLIAVFDVDSTELAAFDEEDAAGLEAILASIFS